MIIDIRNFKSFPKFQKKFLSKFPKDYDLKENEDNCWIWQGCKFTNTYGQILYSTKSYNAHMMSYITFNGLIPHDKVVRHTCDNKLCVNPKHLILGTQSDNILDYYIRGGKSKKLNEEAVKVIKWMFKYKNYRGLSIKLAALYGVSLSTIIRVKNNQIWSWVEV